MAARVSPDGEPAQAAWRVPGRAAGSSAGNRNWPGSWAPGVPHRPAPGEPSCWKARAASAKPASSRNSRPPRGGRPRAAGRHAASRYARGSLRSGREDAGLHHGQCGLSRSAAPFGIWADALGDLVADTGPPPADEPWTATLARIVPALAGPGGPPRRAAGGRPAAGTRSPVRGRRPVPHLGVPPGSAAAGHGGPARGRHREPRADRLRGPPAQPAARAARPDQAPGTWPAGSGRRARRPAVPPCPRHRYPPGAATDDAARALIRQTADVPERWSVRSSRCAAGRPLLAVETARAAAAGRPGRGPRRRRPDRSRPAVRAGPDVR